MRAKQIKQAIVPALLFTGAVLAAACDSPPVDDTRVIAPRGVIRGTVLYQGQRPCTENGHVVGNLIVLLFDRRNPPPPTGIATTAVNFGVVTGDALFPNEPRSSRVRVCPAAGSAPITSTAPFAISPLDAASYVVQAFFDTTGNFLPTFKIRNLPEKGDVGGGYVDTTDAAKHAGDINYTPIFLPVDVGVRSPTAPSGFVMPPEGFVADGVAVTVGLPLVLPRPYFYPDGSQGAGSRAPSPANPDGNPNYVPIATMPQDQQLLAPPAFKTADTVAPFQAAFTSLKLVAGLPDGERPSALDPLGPFRFQAPSFADGGGLFVWSPGGVIPEGQGVPSLFPLVILAKLADDPTHAIDRQGILAQGARGEAPIVIIQAITIAGDSLLDTVLTKPQSGPTEAGRQDHVTALVRPTAICFDPRQIDRGGLLVTPHTKGPSSDPTEVVPPEGKDLFDAAAVLASQSKLVREIAIGCLPTGRYGINLVYPTGQAWTVPNESGSCASTEGDVELPPGSPVLFCNEKRRPVLYSQGTRAVLEIVEAQTPEGKAYCQSHRVPDACLKLVP
ncbi:MAG: hypothetical protein JWM74_4365 [Myxococcaceae bacterium]|nr:hypothetical protein [Myxococcaceae bacterium]